MDPFRQLKTELQGYDFVADPERAQGNKILNALDTILDHDEGELDRGQPPLELLAYAFNSILYPSFLPELLSDLLHLMTMIEFYRIQVTEKASFLLDLNTYFKMQQESQTVSLSKFEQEYCRRLVDTQEDLRQIFLSNVMTCCVLDLKRLWLANSNTDFWLRWNEYFSIFRGDTDVPEKPSHSFHHKIKPEEIAFFRDSASQLTDFMEDTVRTAAEQANRGQSIQEMFQSQTFREQFLPSTLPAEVLETLTYHLNVVVDAVEKIEAIKSID